MLYSAHSTDVIYDKELTLAGHFLLRTMFLNPLCMIYYKKMSCQILLCLDILPKWPENVRCQAVIIIPVIRN